MAVLLRDQVDAVRADRRGERDMPARAPQAPGDVVLELHAVHGVDRRETDVATPQRAIALSRHQQRGEQAEATSRQPQRGAVADEADQQPDVERKENQGNLHAWFASRCMGWW